MPDEIQPEPDAQAARLVTQRLNEITKRANSVKHRFWISYFAVCFCLLGIVILFSFLIGPYHPLSHLMWIPFCASTLISLALGFKVMAWTTPKFHAAELARAGGVQAIPPLFATLKVTPSAKQRQEIEDALKILLPQMKSSDAHLLTPDARQAIHATLNTHRVDNPMGGYPYGLRIAMLKALEQVGDASAIQVVRRIANKKPRTPAEAEFQQAAIECLPMLLANCGDVEAARTLLRASHAEDARPDTLLRPASGSPQTNPAELLRGSEPPETQE